MDRIAKLNEMLRQKPGDPFLQHALGLEYIRLGDETEAERLFRSLLDGNPGYVGTYYQLATLLVRQGRGEEAIGICEKGLAACKAANDDHAWRELNSIYEDLIY
jgi:tetratricopeptide (TPR) repeat protein